MRNELEYSHDATKNQELEGVRTEYHLTPRSLLPVAYPVSIAVRLSTLKSFPDKAVIFELDIYGYTLAAGFH